MYVQLQWQHVGGGAAHCISLPGVPTHLSCTSSTLTHPVPVYALRDFHVEPHVIVHVIECWVLGYMDLLGLQSDTSQSGLLISMFSVHVVASIGV